MTNFALRFDPNDILKFANQYPAEDDLEVVVEKVIAPKVREQGHYTRDELITVCRWKTPRSKPRVAENNEEFVCEVTQTALSTSNEKLRIEVLTLLSGVSWPTASVLLHYGYDNLYPILDYRALWSLSTEVPMYYDFPFWWEYTVFCRNLAREVGVSMRVLDRALWQYSKDNQK
jgi:hypothetical protein